MALLDVVMNRKRAYGLTTSYWSRNNCTELQNQVLLATKHQRHDTGVRQQEEEQR